MTARIRLFGALGLFWIVFFEICRAIFLVYHWEQTIRLSWREIGTVMLLGLRMDAAMTGYWLIIPGILLAVPLENPRIILYPANIVTFLFLIFSSIIVVVDLELYAHWGFRMNTTPLFYLGSEAAGSVHPAKLFLLVFILAALLSGAIMVYLKIISPRFLQLHRLPLRHIPAMVLLVACLIIPIRSSFSVAPLNTGVVYFHKTLAFPNHAGINATWNFMNSWFAQEDPEYPRDFFDPQSASRVLSDMVRNDSPAPSFLRPGKPNIILIVLESFTSKIIEPLGGLPEITPRLNALTREGILFDNFYASGDRTDKGLIAILSGYPAQPLSSIIKYPEKTQRLGHVSRALQRLGYHSSFVYGGDVGFANMESYLVTGGYSHITEEDDFGMSFNSKWGVPDHIVFERLAEECDTAHFPFFKVMLSLSSHEPFDVPADPVFEGTDERTLFLNACHYTDRSLGAFIDRARKSAWWNSTLIILTADHGHHFPNNAEELKEKDRFRIPMLWLGGALTKTDTVIHTLGSQTDIPNTLLGQVDHTVPEFKFSKNLLEKDVQPFAIYIFHNGYGMVDPAGETIYDFDFHKFVKQDGSTENQERGMAYLQALFDDYDSK